MDSGNHKDGFDSHGAEEAGAGHHHAAGDPASWSWSEPYQVAMALTRDHVRFWLMLALLSALSSVHVLVAVAMGPVFFTLVVGGAMDRLEGGGTSVAGTWRRWKGRVGALIGVSLLTTLALGLWVGGVLTASTVAAATLHGAGANALVLAAGGLLAVFGMVVQSYYLAFVHEVVLVEGEGVLGSLGRSVGLAHQGGGSYAAFYFGYMTIFSALQFFLAFGGGCIGAAAHGGDWLAWGAGKAGIVALTFFGSLLQQGLTVTWVCRYLHDRAR